MTSIKLSAQERDALRGLSYLQIALYVMGIRSNMDFNTRIVGQKFRISWQSFCEELYIEAVPGTTGKTPTKSAIRRAAAQLEKAGLIKIFSNKTQLLIECVLAGQDQSAQITADRGPTSQSDTVSDEKAISKSVSYENEPGEADIANFPRSGTYPVSGNTKEKPTTTSVVVVKKKNEVCPRKRQLAERFEVTQRHMELAAKNGWPNPQGEIDAFRDYHLARGTVMKDWDRAFYTWLRNARRFKQQGGNHSGLSRREQAIVNTIETCLPDGYSIYEN